MRLFFLYINTLAVRVAGQFTVLGLGVLGLEVAVLDHDDVSLRNSELAEIDVDIVVID